MKLEWKSIPLQMFKESIKLNYSKMDKKLVKHFKFLWDNYNIPIYGAFIPNTKIPSYVIVIYDPKDDETIKNCSISIYDNLSGEISGDVMDPFYDLPQKFFIKSSDKSIISNLIETVNANLKLLKQQTINYHNQYRGDILGYIK